MPGLAWILNKVVLLATSVLIGAFYPHWLTDYALIWQGPEVSSHAVATSLGSSRRFPPQTRRAPPALTLRVALVQLTTRPCTMRRTSTSQPCRLSPVAPSSPRQSASCSIP